MKMNVLRVLYLFYFRNAKLDLLKPIGDDLDIFEERRLAAEARVSQVPLGS